MGHKKKELHGSFLTGFDFVELQDLPASVFSLISKHPYIIGRDKIVLGHITFSAASGPIGKKTVASDSLRSSYRAMRTPPRRDSND